MKVHTVLFFDQLCYNFARQLWVVHLIYKRIVCVITDTMLDRPCCLSSSVAFV